MEWQFVTGSTYTMDMGYPMVGLYRLGRREVVFVDTGVTDSPDLSADLAAEGLSVRAIICTHIHPDHIANNYRLHQQFGCPIYADAWEVEEAQRTDRPLAPPGKTPPPITPIPAGARELVIDGASFALLPTPGHTPGQLAVTTPDHVCFLGDAILMGDVLAGAKLPYIMDVDRAIRTMYELMEVDEPWFSAAHKGVLAKKDMKAVLQQNIDKELHIYDVLRRRLTRPTPVEELLTAFMEDLGLDPNRPRRFPRRPTFTLAEQRLTALEKAGECALRDGVVYPL